MTYLAANGLPVTRLELILPYYGAPTVDLDMDGLLPLVGRVSVAIGALVLACSVLQPSGAFAGQTSARLVGGAGGWGKPVAPQAYGPAATVPMVLGDAALTVGETVVAAAAPCPGFCRSAGPASRVLRQLAGALWWIDLRGVTQVAPSRPSVPIATPFDLERGRRGDGWFRVATENPEAWLPGATFTAPTVPDAQMVSLVHLTAESDGTMLLEVLVA